MEKADISIFNDNSVVDMVYSKLISEGDFITSMFVMYLSDRLVEMSLEPDTIQKYVPVFNEINSYKTAFEYKDCVLFEYRALYKDILSLDETRVDEQLRPISLMEMKELVETSLSKKRPSSVFEFLNKVQTAAKQQQKIIPP